MTNTQKSESLKRMTQCHPCRRFSYWYKTIVGSFALLAKGLLLGAGKELLRDWTWKVKRFHLHPRLFHVRELMITFLGPRLFFGEYLLLWISLLSGFAVQYHTRTKVGGQGMRRPEAAVQSGGPPYWSLGAGDSEASQSHDLACGAGGGAVPNPFCARECRLGSAPGTLSVPMLTFLT
ncbi:hypothetical protein B0T24DRAFT_87290 [Lasiosphaeria ovina]|uniref:Uncharacterized protein n=1 Tax=Lasiosphaeria ovina TaxID=92902 RepID=A0AAE0TYN7_9PEZI|nr:hypothetical protein B0T24DRAFT_87290 [Lasiosphaeria ovina]